MDIISENFIKNPESRTALQIVVEQLLRVQAFGFFAQRAAKASFRNPTTPQDPVKEVALEGAFRAGYMAAFEDLLNSDLLFQESKQKGLPQPNFGARKPESI